MGRRLERRLRRLEIRHRPGEAERMALWRAWCDRLLTFLEATFERGPKEPWISVTARLCGLPNGRAFLEAGQEGGLNAEAFLAAGKRLYGKRWREEMLGTMEPLIVQCHAVRGDEGLQELDAVLPTRDIYLALHEDKTLSRG